MREREESKTPVEAGFLNEGSEVVRWSPVLAALPTPKLVKKNRNQGGGVRDWSPKEVIGLTDEHWST